MTGTPPHPRLHVLCAHEPDADPRIGWTAQVAARHGYGVRVVGWIAGRKPADSDDPSETIRLGFDSPARSGSWLMMQLIFRLCWPLLPVAAVLAGLLVPLWAVTTLALLPWRILDYAAEVLDQHERTTRRVERIVLAIRAWFFWRVDGLFRGGLVQLINGLNAYRWYFFSHAGALARRYIKWLDEHPGERPNVIHANDPDALMAAVLAKLAYGCRVVYDAHEYGPEAYLLHTQPRGLFFAYERMVMRHVDGAVTVSPLIAAKFNAAYGDRLCFAVVPNASPLADVLVPDPQFSLDELAKGRVRVLYQGGFAAQRGLEQVLAAWTAVDDSKAALFMRGPDNDFQRVLVRAAEKTGRLNSSIFFLPSVSEDKLTIAALDADIGLVPYLSHIENHQGACPNKVGQYMQAGLTIVSAKLPFVASLLAEGECGDIYDDNSDVALSKTLEKLIQDPETIARKGQNGRTFARNHYNFEAYFPVLDNLYQTPETGSNHLQTKTFAED
jgi:glycosyltransferase involved in cell wall biosynthesis